MRLFQYTFFICIIFFISCDSSDYSEEEEAKLEEAQKIHNEAMATYAESKNLLAELTKVRSELRRRSGLDGGGENASQDTTLQDTTTENGLTNSGTSNNSGNRSSADTATVSNNAQDALDKLNKAQNNLLSWMRDIYTVPGLNEKKEEKTKDPALGMDFDSRRLMKDIEFKEYPEDTSIDEIYKDQKEMKEEIDRINKDMKKAIEEGKDAYMSI